MEHGMQFINLHCMRGSKVQITQTVGAGVMTMAREQATTMAHSPRGGGSGLVFDL